MGVSMTALSMAPSMALLEYAGGACLSKSSESRVSGAGVIEIVSGTASSRVRATLLMICVS